MRPVWGNIERMIFAQAPKSAIVGIAAFPGVTDIQATPKSPDDSPVVLQIVPTLETGGAERTTIDVARALARAGMVPLVATKGGRMLAELDEAGAKWLPAPVHSKAPHTLIANVFRLRDIIRRRNVSIVHARSRAPAWSALLAARMTGVPFVTTYHGIYNAKSGLKRFYNSVMARGDVVIANSAWTAAHIGREYPHRRNRIVVIPRGVNLSRFDPAHISATRVEAVRQHWRVRPDDLVVLLPGRLTRWKGQTVLIDAFAALKRGGEYPSVKAVLVGDAQGRDLYEAELREQIVKNGLMDIVRIAGHESDMPAAYSASDIVVSASTDPEAFGRVAAEAGAMERVVIATDHGGAREIILPGVSGLLVPPGDSAALADALKSLIDGGPELRARMGREARLHVARRFTVEQMCADTLGVYRDVLARWTKSGKVKKV